MSRHVTLCVLVVLGVLASGVARADDPSSQPARPLVIGTKQAPPFAIKLEDGSWEGISIELWRQVAADLGVVYEIREYDLQGLLDAVRTHEVDVGVGAITINAKREALMDFTHPVFSTGLSIAVLRHERDGFLATLARLVTLDFAKVVLALLLLLAAVGMLVWLAERRKNADQFGGGPMHGVGAGLWWSAVTMTTVGYGDKAPVTVAGRLIALTWMFAAIIITSMFTASLTSALTVDQLQSAISGPEDLARVRVGTVAGSTSAGYLDRRKVDYSRVADVTRGAKAVVSGKLDAIVYDAPILQYVAKHEIGDSLLVLPRTFTRQDYGFALPEGSELREPLNRALLAAMNRSRWHAVLEHYLGTPE